MNAQAPALAAIAAPKLKRDWPGRTVRTTSEMRNGRFVVPAGSVATIERHSPAGSALLFRPCPCCGMQARIAGVRGGFEFVAEAAP
jgi:hypothetical protein